MTPLFLEALPGPRGRGWGWLQAVERGPLSLHLLGVKGTGARTFIPGVWEVTLGRIRIQEL